MSLRIVSGKFKSRMLQTPKGQATRPTQESVREALFNICQATIEGATVLDLFAGSGAIGFEALSRGASHVTFVENNSQAIACIKKNISLLDVSSSTTLITQDAFIAMKRLEKFDFIFVDPPYDVSLNPIVDAIVAHNLLSPHGKLFCEELYLPKLKPLTHEMLILKSSRRFGKTSLLEFTRH